MRNEKYLKSNEIDTPKSILEKLAHAELMADSVPSLYGHSEEVIEQEIFFPGTLCMYVSVSELCSELYLEGFSDADSPDSVIIILLYLVKFLIILMYCYEEYYSFYGIRL